MSGQPPKLTASPEGYADWLAELKARIHSAQQRAALAVNRELVLLYWQIGRDILTRQAELGWGAKVIERLSQDLRVAFPDMKGFSRANLMYMRAFAEAWPDAEIVQQAVGQLPWGHNLVLLSKLKAPTIRLAYAQAAIEHGWSRNVLNIHIETRRLERSGQAVTNFAATLPKPQSDLSRQSLKDPYLFDFLGVGDEANEREIESALVKHVTEFLLELGAGAGRNTPRYTGFERVVLLDYSRTQLLQARERLGDNPRYLYVAADIYKLPFVDGLFDGATMIRTLHHMAQPGLAIQSIRRVLRGNAQFLLEFANKRNLKSILRYLLGRQPWNPFSPEQVEFVVLNFDFHPKTIRRLLKENNFAIEKQLNVSQFRVAWLKKHVPLGILVGLDSALQWTGAFAQYAPSVWTLARAAGPSAQTASVWPWALSTARSMRRLQNRRPSPRPRQQQRSAPRHPAWRSCWG